MSKVKEYLSKVYYAGIKLVSKEEKDFYIDAVKDAFSRAEKEEIRDKLRITSSVNNEKLANLIANHLEHIPGSYVHGPLGEARIIIDIIKKNRELLD